MSESDPAHTAANYFRQAYELQMSGEYPQAIEMYSRSIAAFPTAEAYTFRGWTYSFLGDYERAMQDWVSRERSWVSNGQRIAREDLHDRGLR